MIDHDGPLTLQVKMPFVNTINPQSKKFDTGVSFHVMPHLKLRVLHNKLVLHCIVLYWCVDLLATSNSKHNDSPVK